MRQTTLTCIASATLALGGCGDPPGPSNDMAVPPIAAANDATLLNDIAPAPPVPAAKASVTKVETPDYNFTYSYPAQAAAIAPLAAWLDQDREDLRKSLISDTAEARKDAKQSGYEYRAYDSATEWKLVTETPRLLSLSADIYSFTGGAHGSPGFTSVVWDKTGAKRLEPDALFTSKAALQSVLGTPFCKAIDAERVKRRGGAVQRSDDPFNGCPKVEEATLILGSTNRQAIDRVGLLVGPYVAGPYAEGSYEMTLPVTAQLIATVRPDYRDAFAAR